MPSLLTPQLEVIWTETDVDTVLAAQQQLLSLATKEDLPELVEALRSDRNDFWTRELISEPVAYLGGVECIPELLDALGKNISEGHDSDSLLHLLAEIAVLNHKACRAKLEALRESSESRNKDHIDWLLGFCN